MKNTISRHPLISFFVMALLLSWIVVTPLILNQALPVEPFLILGALAGPTNLSAEMHAFVFSGWIPAIMGGIMAALILMFTKGSLSYKKSQ